MRKFTILAALAFSATAFAAPAAAQQAIDFGDDSSDWANDGECDDPRFEGDGMAEILLSEDVRSDAADCRALHAAGKITYIGMENSVPSANTARNTVAVTLRRADDTTVDFGDDSSEWANDGECDDPRFTGTGMAGVLLEEDARHDATDCRTLYAAGSIRLRGAAGTTSTGGLDFGDDSSEWANDGECDDPRFTGAGMADILLEEDARRDATDCRTLYEAGSIRISAGGRTASSIDFGDNSSEWANDGECDDPRFTGTGMAETLLAEDSMHDASDCRTLFDSGSIHLID
ncbi:hypothetical protein QQS45_13585 [Alteriqipengyuania flavescens]|uniref:hypothetical protein n=1 Tax=Alteriqipengyuania flavescens TaxID=3053610 RepID=UPI0025B49227|nr:hypothetical protein [Alteriqipengyuania flavescens]WJY18618.1 hypothetical protein QQW98_13580 [Alteriqipengyuania flavescens]WJY24558.1 hypothetical protein QQS45_13585 [Alteriqipengyuania flavescens]